MGLAYTIQAGAFNTGCLCATEAEDKESGD